MRVYINIHIQYVRCWIYIHTYVDRRSTGGFTALFSLPLRKQERERREISGLFFPSQGKSLKEKAF